MALRVIVWVDFGVLGYLLGSVQHHAATNSPLVYGTESPGKAGVSCRVPAYSLLGVPRPRIAWAGVALDTRPAWDNPYHAHELSTRLLPWKPHSAWPAA